MNLYEQPASITLYTRWMIRRDMPEILAIEQNTPDAWDEDRFLTTLKERNCIAMVAESADKVVGHVVYELHKNHVELLRIAVHPSWWRRGVGTLLVDKLISKLSSHRRRFISVAMPETNVGAQLFLRAKGFLAKCVLRDHRHSGQDAYLMRFNVTQPAEMAS